jgi:S-formylglutathione hydrolase FrmB
MRKCVFFLLALSVLTACGTSSTKDNDPWGNIDPAEADKQSAVIEGSLRSSVMNQNMTYSVWLPAGYDKSKTYPFLYLLHGYEMGDQSRLDRCWLDKGNAAKIADDYQKTYGVAMIIIMPNGLSSFYQGDYENYMHEELMAKVEKDYHCNGQRAIAGLSMGGYGTLYHALKYPSKFVYAYAMSPAADTWMASLIDDKSVYPGFTIEVGLQDYTVDNSKAKSLYNSMVKKGISCDWVERDGTHDWPFWQVCLPKALIKAGKAFK